MEAVIYIKNFFEKKALGGCKIQIFVIGDNNSGCGDWIAETRRRSVRYGDDFDWLGGHSANYKAPEVSSAGLMVTLHPLPRFT